MFGEYAFCDHLFQVRNVRSVFFRSLVLIVTNMDNSKKNDLKLWTVGLKEVTIELEKIHVTKVIKVKQNESQSAPPSAPKVTLASECAQFLQQNHKEHQICDTEIEGEMKSLFICSQALRYSIDIFYIFKENKVEKRINHLAVSNVGNKKDKSSPELQTGDDDGMSVK